MQKYIRTNYDINFQHDSLRHQVLVYQPRALSNRISSEVFGVLIKFQDRWNSSLAPDLNWWLCCVPPLSLACCWGGSVNTGFRVGLLSVVGTTGHACAEMLNVSTRSICLLRKRNGTFPSLFFFQVDSQLWEMIAVQIPSWCLVASQLAERRKKKLKSGHYNQWQLLFVHLSCGRAWARRCSHCTCHTILSCDLHLKCCHVYLHISDKTSHFSY